MIGQTIGHYKIVEKLGAGGMGEVYRAEDMNLDREVALKMLPPDLTASSKRLARLKREAQALAALDHPNIITIYAVEKIDGRPLLAMELIKGRTLSDFIPESGLNLHEFFNLAIPLAEALSAAHEQGVIHRDLKPSNIMVSDDGHLKVLDFGLAKLRPQAGQPVDTEMTTDALTAEGHILGTMPYMAPEQVQGHAVDQRSDIFSLGIILYQMATGHRPFRGTSSAELVSSILRDEPDPVDELKREMPHHLARIIRQCLEKELEHRLESAKDVGIQLEDLQREITTQERATIPQIPEPPPQASRWAFWLTGAMALVAVAVAIVAWLTQEKPQTVPWALSPEAQELVLQAEAYERRGDTREDLAAAEQRYRRALRLEPEHPLLQSQLAALLARIQKQYPAKEQAEEAKLLAEQALEQDTDLPAAYVALGTLSLLAGDAAQAMDAARQAQAANPQAYSGYTLLGEALIAQDRVDEGLVALRRGVELAGADQRARAALARVLTDLGSYSEAAAEYERILEHDPDLPAALSNLAGIYMRTGRELDAIPLLNRALRLGDDEAAASNLGYIYFNLEQFEKAIEMFERAYEINPSKPYAPFNIADTYLALGEQEAARPWFEQALANFNQVLEAGGPRSQTLALRALCAARLGRFDEALSGVDEALALDPSSTHRLFNAAQVAALAGDDERLFAYMTKALDLGHPRQYFYDDAAFTDYQDHPDFLRVLLEAEKAS